MKASTYALIGFGALALLLAPLTKHKHSTPITGMSPKFDGRDPSTDGDYFKSKATGLWLFSKHFPARGQAKAAVVLLHGYAEHLQRYSHIAQLLNEDGYEVYAMDHQGHGKSEGDRAYIERYEDLEGDCVQFTEDVIAKSNGLPVFVFGHSMGGLLAVRVALSRVGKSVKAVVLSAPALDISPEVATPMKMRLANALSNYLPKLAVPPPIDPSTLFVDPVHPSADDPLMHHGSPVLRYATEFFKMLDDTKARHATLRLPIYAFHGDNDRLTPIAGTKLLEKAAGSNNKQNKFTYVPGGLHEIIQEKAIWKKHVQDARAWMNGVLSA